jgi:CelD/BcsL family acetyltransferase involved in cellulose biosynthesis
MTLHLATLTRLDELVAIEPEWRALFRDSGAPNPFALPAWAITWARHFVAPGRLRCIAVREDGGRLVGLAPLYLDVRGTRLRVARLRLLGARDAPDLSEIQQVLALPGNEREVLRAVVRHALAELDAWDWLELMLAPGQGWLEPQWVPPEQGFVLHKATWAYVVLPLQATWEAQRAQLKRNVRESIRRSENRLRADGRPWRIEDGHDPEAARAAIAALVRLNRARGELEGKESHRTAFPSGRDAAFALDAALALAPDGHLETLVLRAEEEAAALLTLSANGTVFLSASGLDPAWWRHGPGTALVAEALRRAIARGAREANLSSGPDRAKLRWSEELRYAHEFVIARRGRRRRLLLDAYWLARAARQVRTEAAWHRARR